MWKKGQSGNPQGGKITAEVRRVLHAYAVDGKGNVEVDEDGNKLKNLNIIARKLVAKAKAGDQYAIQTILERIEGKVPNVNVEVPVKPLEDMSHDELVQAIIGIADNRGTEADSTLTRAKPAGSA